LGDFDHEPVGDGWIFKTFVYVVEKTTTKQRMMEKFMAGASLNFKRILDDLDLFQIEFLKPSSSFLCRWPFV